jgi:hypothetical protein
MIKKRQSLKQIYTLEDLVVLQGMVSEIFDKKAKIQTSGATWQTWGDAIPNYSITHRHAYLKPDLKNLIDNKKDIRYFINKVCSKGMSRWVRAFLEGPIEEAPLYLNDRSEFKQVMAKWRLTIAK